MINMGRVIHSPRLSQRITVLRTKAEMIEGEFVEDEPETLVFRGIITLVASKAVEEVEGGDRLTGRISVLTKQELYLTGSDHISDIVVWRGARFRVVDSATDADWGFFRSTCIRLEGDGIG